MRHTVITRDSVRSAGRARRVVCALALGSALAGAAASSVAYGDWPNWRGPDQNGIARDKGWFKSWPADGPKLLWEANLGEGYSSMSVAGGKVYAMGNAQKKDTVWCFDAATGKVLWRYDYACGSDRAYPGPRATPTVDGSYVYTMSRKAQVFCLDAGSGKVVWQRDVAAETGAKAPQWDFSGSILVDGKNLVLNVGTAGLALDKAQGTTVWQSGKGTCGYAAPVAFELGGKRGIAIFGAQALVAVDPGSGRVLWQHAWKTSYDVNAPDPVFTGDKAFITSGYGTGCCLLAIGAAGANLVWQNKNMAAHFASPLLIDGCLYGFTGQINDRRASFVCLDLASGAVKWRKDGMNGHATAADGKLLMLEKGGELIVADASPAGYSERARAQVLGGDCWTPPVLDAGRIYCRNTQGRLVCLEAGAK